MKNSETGQCEQKESFSEQEKMKVKHEQVYLGDVISDDGKQVKNVQARKSKSLGIITQIMEILKSVYFGKYHNAQVKLAAFLLTAEF